MYGDVAQEVELVARAQAGDREAFAALILAYQQPVGGYLWRLSGDRELAQDLTQDTFLRAYRAIGATRPGLQLRSWLYRIATNLAYDHFRRQRRFGFVPLLPVEGPAYWEEPTGVDEADAVWRALAHLRPNDRAALLLCAQEGYSYREAAVILGTSPEAVRKLFGRAKQRFRRAYAEQTAAGESNDDPPDPVMVQSSDPEGRQGPGGSVVRRRAPMLKLAVAVWALWAAWAVRSGVRRAARWPRQRASAG
ncbi:MAG: RNA polymerase sigma factor [Chloroflexi bacterium]|nr:MAG: RNA polymerase sigma factor [Chloroflexota bacterium]